MTPYERMKANQDDIEYRIAGITFRVTEDERRLGSGMRVEPVSIGVAENEMDSVWRMSPEQEDRSKLEALRTRVNKIKRHNPPEPEMRPYIPGVGYVFDGS